MAQRRQQSATRLTEQCSRQRRGAPENRLNIDDAGHGGVKELPSPVGRTAAGALAASANLGRIAQAMLFQSLVLYKPILPKMSRVLLLTRRCMYCYAWQRRPFAFLCIVHCVRGHEVASRGMNLRQASAFCCGAELLHMLRPRQYEPYIRVVSLCRGIHARSVRDEYPSREI